VNETRAAVARRLQSIEQIDAGPLEIRSTTTGSGPSWSNPAIVVVDPSIRRSADPSPSQHLPRTSRWVRRLTAGPATPR